MDHNFKDILHNVNLTEGQISVILNSLDHTLIRIMLFSLVGLQIKSNHKFICVVLIISNYKWAFV